MSVSPIWHVKLFCNQSDKIQNFIKIKKLFIIKYGTITVYVEVNYFLERSYEY